ncbi:hypothetical protein F7R21_14275 [Burkholderia latens]|uniref:Uncharacterized protein n=1 Tax=Burkholderia latens TaxID=488446 RepID=A0A6H9TDN1_9BURK|nr:hypothetical protein F7R21_14275 [Burkholderia latens]
MHGGNVVSMKQAGKGGVARRAIDANATIAQRVAGRGRPDRVHEWRTIEKPEVHAHATANGSSNGAVDAYATTGAAASAAASRAGARISPAGQRATARAYRCVRDPVRAAPGAARAPFHCPALLIQPYSLFCIVLVGELPTDFPDRAVGES